MGIVELALIAVGLSMDAFAVAICKGLAMKRLDVRQGLIIALFFGGFQALMPSIGWLLGAQLQFFITPIDHWIAFVLLVFIGGKMVFEALREIKEEKDCACDTAAELDLHPRLDIREIALLAVATSIDALAVGITFAFLQVDIVFSASLIGLVTFVISFAGVVVGQFFGARFKHTAELLGGLVLIGIGLKILLEHLGFLA